MATIQIATNIAQIQACFPCFQELRPHLTNITQFANQILSQQQEGYQIAFIMDAGAVAACIGYRYLTTLAWGRILYIDDLITHPTYRGKGYGRQLLQHTIQLAKTTNCHQVHLDTGYMRHDAHRVYLNQGFNLNCHHLSLILDK